MKVKTSILNGVALDWAVAKCEGYDLTADDWLTAMHSPDWDHTYTEDWAQGGPIIEKEKIDVVYKAFAQSDDKQWVAMNDCPGKHYGPTPLVAAMRCYVASCLGDDVDIPEDLL